jgi:1-acyl-sn-glycerol-3-phosphate acyltransferase
VNPTAARLRLASLWVSQVARIAADNALRIYVALRLAAAVPAAQGYAWHLLTALVMLPAIVLAPFNGALGNSLPKRLVLAGAALYCLAVVAGAAVLGGPGVLGWALLAVGAAVYSPVRYALLPAAATDAHMPLTRVNAWIETGAVAATIAGMALGVHLEHAQATLAEWPPTLLAVLGLNAVAVIAALPVAFAADVRRPESAGAAVAGFFRDAGRIWRDLDSRATLLGLGALRGLVAGSAGAFFAVVLSDETRSLLERIESAFDVLVWLTAGAAAGSLLAGVARHPRRALGLVPLGVLAMAIGLVLAANGSQGRVICVLLGAGGGLVNVPLAAAYQLYLPADARGNGMAIRNFCDYVCMAAVAGLLFALAGADWLTPDGQFWLMAALAIVAALAAWAILFREIIELATEVLLTPLYRVRAHGAIDQFPQRGPLVVVANHAAWFDPIWLAKVLPRSLRPMMTAMFYDLPVMRWLMKHVARAIRVPVSTYRREAPELQEAIAALDAGECVVIFPEGSLRRTDERPLRRFGQGVAHILAERPETPVVVCWIEGNWRSFFSYWKGPPAKNKKFDFWRRIDIAVGPPKLMDPEVLADQRRTRAFLEQRCRETRGMLGLEIPKVEDEPSPTGEPAV